MITLGLLGGAAGIAYVIASWVQRHAAYLSLLDIPNQRSMHQQITPRGGGLGVVIGYLVILCCAVVVLELQIVAVAWLLLGCVLMATVGFIDDVIHLSAMQKLAGQCLAIGVALWPYYSFVLLSLLMCFILMLAWVNFVNFMDGIDAYVCVEMISVNLMAAILLWPLMPNVAWMSLLLSAVCIGFFILNRPPARIFLGDVGSCFLGLISGMLVFYSVQVLQHAVWVWLILYAAFWLDALWTLCWRMLSGQRWYAAHCSHAYQHAARRFGAHRCVNRALLCLNVFWLWPWAAAAFYWPLVAVWCLLLACLPLLLLCRNLRAGELDVA